MEIPRELYGGGEGSKVMFGEVWGAFLKGSIGSFNGVKLSREVQSSIS